jgi:hypothetical protein
MCVYIYIYIVLFWPGNWLQVCSASVRQVWQMDCGGMKGSDVRVLLTYGGWWGENVLTARIIGVQLAFDILLYVIDEEAEWSAALGQNLEKTTESKKKWSIVLTAYIRIYTNFIQEKLFDNKITKFMSAENTNTRIEHAQWWSWLLINFDSNAFSNFFSLQLFPFDYSHLIIPIRLSCILNEISILLRAAHTVISGIHVTIWLQRTTHRNKYLKMKIF